MYRGLNTPPKLRIDTNGISGRERSKDSESQTGRTGGVLRSENAGMSSERQGENPVHQMPKVS